MDGAEVAAVPMATVNELMNAAPDLKMTPAGWTRKRALEAAEK